MLSYVRSTCVCAFAAVALSAQTIPVETVGTTGMIGIADSQTAQLNLLNPGVEAPATGVVCLASVAFLDASGSVLKSASFSVPPGTSQPFDLRSDTDLKLVAGDRREIRATIMMPAVPPPTAPATSAATAVACKLVPTLEIFDTVSGRTLVTLGHVVNVPSVSVTPVANP